MMKLYAERFVEEFERPLMQPHLSHRPIQSRLRLKPGRARFDVCLAPEAGLRYPQRTRNYRFENLNFLVISKIVFAHLLLEVGGKQLF